MRLFYFSFFIVAYCFLVSCSSNRDAVIELNGKPQAANMQQIVSKIMEYDGLKDTVLFVDKKYKYVLSPNAQSSSIRYDIYKSGTMRIGSEMLFDEDMAVLALKRKNVTYSDLDKAEMGLVKGYPQLSIDPMVTINEYFELVKEDAKRSKSKDSIMLDLYIKLKDIAFQKSRYSKEVQKHLYLIRHIDYQLSLNFNKLLKEEGMFNTQNLNGQNVLIIVDTYRHKNNDAIDNIEYALKAADRSLELKVELAGSKLNLGRLEKYLLYYAPVSNIESKVIMLIEINGNPLLESFVKNTPVRVGIFSKPVK